MGRGMKLKGFLQRSFSSFLILILITVSSCLALGMCRWSEEYDSCSSFLLVALIFGDALIPLLLFVPALIFRSKFLSLSAIICSLFNVFVRFFSIIVLSETYMPLNYESLKILLIHSDFYSLEAFLGRGFYLWLVPIILLLLAGIVVIGMMVWKSSGKRFGKEIKGWTVFFCVILLFSVISNSIFLVIRPEYAKRSLINPLPLVSAKIVDDALREVSRKHVYVRTELPEKSRQILEDSHVIAKKDEVKNNSECKFDRIIIIAVESLDYDFISGANSRMPAGVTPNLERLSREYLAFNNYYAASQPTSWGLNSLLLSRFDYERDRFFTVPSFFTVAKQQGFHTVYFSAASGLFGNNRVIYEKLFDADQLFFLEEWNRYHRMVKETSWGIPDDKLFNGVYDELKKIGKKRFAVVISTMDTHPPYYVPENKEDLTAVPEDSENEIKNNKFLQTLRHTDHCIGEFVKKVMADETLFDDRTMIIITADHSATHGENYLKRTDLNPDRIPLIFIVKDNSALKDLDPEKFASSIDLAPTLVELIGMDIPESFMGRSLFSPKNLAISRQFGDVLMLRGEGIDRNVDCYAASETEEDQAFIDFYFSHYTR